MAFNQRFVLKNVTSMSLHERFSQLRQKVTPPDAPTYHPPAARAKTAPPAPPRISDEVEVVYQSPATRSQYHGSFRARSQQPTRNSNRPMSHSLAFEMAMKIKRKSIRQRLGYVNRNGTNFKPPYYRRNWGRGRGGRGGYQNRRWGWGRGRSQSLSNLKRYKGDWDQSLDTFTNNRRTNFRRRGRWGRGGRFNNRFQKQKKETDPEKIKALKNELDAEMDEYMAGTKTVLDKEMDDYMAGTKTILDKEMDEYMAQGKSVTNVVTSEVPALPKPTPAVNE